MPACCFVNYKKGASNPRVSSRVHRNMYDTNAAPRACDQGYQYKSVEKCEEVAQEMGI